VLARASIGKAWTRAGALVEIHTINRALAARNKLHTGRLGLTAVIDSKLAETSASLGESFEGVLELLELTTWGFIAHKMALTVHMIDAVCNRNITLPFCDFL